MRNRNQNQAVAPRKVGARIVAGFALALLAGACSTSGTVSGQAVATPNGYAMQQSAPTGATDAVADNRSAEAVQQRYEHQPAQSDNGGSYAMQQRGGAPQSF